MDEWQHPERERLPLGVDSEHLSCICRRLGLRMLRIGLPRLEPELAVLQPGIG